MDFVKVKDLNPESKGFNIKIKVLEKESDRIVTIKKTQMQNRVANFTVGDETGKITLTVWGVDIDNIPIGQSVCVEKGYIREFNNKLYLNIGKFSKWSKCKDEIEASKEPQVKKKTKRKDTMIKIDSITDKEKNVNLEKVKVLEVKNIRQIKSKKDGSEHEVADILIGDETGIIKCSVWDEDIKQIETEMILQIHNAYITKYKGAPQLSISRFSKYEILPPEDLDVNIENNLSMSGQVS